MIGETVSHYRVLARLGGGGMGVVYEAEDTRLHRRVALKFVSDDTADQTALQRFRREAEAASALNHPHICTIYDIGEHEGRPFIVMEKLEGRTLGDFIDAQPVSLGRTLTLGSEIADALAAAHAAGIVHRDVKPSNIFVTARGDAKLLDFGLARLDTAKKNPTASDAETEANLTTPGATLGTIAYMSPEQARGEAVDARSDLFSLGAVLYEMVTGVPPFRGDTGVVICDAILNRQPPPPSQLNPDVPRDVDQVILSALEKDRELRVQSAVELRAALRRLRRDGSPSMPAAPAAATARWLFALPALAIVAAMLWFTKAHHAIETPAAPREKRIAVLPFENLGAPDDNYFADGMTEEVRGKLSSVRGLAVIARASSYQYKGTKKTPREIANELGVNYLLTGTIRWQKMGQTSRIRTSPELVEISGTGAPLTRWENSYDADLADVFEVQGRIASQVANALQVALGEKETRQLEERPTSNLAAYDAFIKGREIWSGTFDNSTWPAAAAHFEQAVALDPNFALAWAYLSMCDSHRFDSTRQPPYAEAARAAAEKAIALSPNLAEARGALGKYALIVTGDPARSAVMIRRGLEVAPDNTDLLRNLSYAERQLGHLDEALTAERRALQLDPRNWSNYAALTDTLLLLKRWQEARTVADRGLAVTPNLGLIWDKAETYVEEGDLAGARAVVASAPKEIEPTALVVYFSGGGQYLLNASQRDLLLRLTPTAFGGNRLAWAHALASENWLRGNSSEARKYAEEARKEVVERVKANPGDPFLHGELGWTLALLGRRAEAVQEGRRTLELLPAEKDQGSRAGLLEYVVWIHVILGDQEEAIDIVEKLLKGPYPFTPGTLRVVPWFDPLRGNPRFEKLARGAS